MKGALSPPAVLKPCMLPEKRNIMSVPCLQQVRAMRIVLSANPAVFMILMPSMLPAKKQHHIITMFAVSEICADHFVFRWGRAAHPPPKPPLC